MKFLLIAMRAPCHQGEGSLHLAHADSPPCDVPPSPDISHPEFYPADFPPYPDMLSGSLTKVSKPYYVIPIACHSPRSAVFRWCVRTPCPDIFAMDSKELSSISDCFVDQKAIKAPKLNTILLELIARVLNMLIGLKCYNYYSKVFKRVNYKLSNNTF